MADNSSCSSSNSSSSINSSNSISLYRNPFKEEYLIDKLLSLGPVQPKGIVRKSTNVLVSGRLKSLKFQDSWYDGRPWLEYCVEEDKACCFYCRVFKPKSKGSC
jgi:hypothetical protein